jgi:predicted HTH domain antitoxin
MKTLQINIPDTLDADAPQLSFLLASQLYERGMLSLGHAAELSGLSKRTFAEMLGGYGVSLFNYHASELLRDISNA